MKKTLFLAAFATLIFAGCAKEATVTEPQPAPTKGDVTLYATMPEFLDASTKATVDGDNGVFSWNNGDCIEVVYAKEGAEDEKIVFECTEASAGKFELPQGVDIPDGYTLKTTGTIAYYPTGYNGTASNPLEAYTDLDEAKAGFQMHATYEDGKLKFVHDNALLKVTVNNVPAFAKKLTVGSVSINLNLSAAGVVNAYVPMAPAAAAKMSIAVTDGSNTIVSKNSAKSVAIEAANLYTLPDLPIGPVVDITKYATSWNAAYVYLFTGDTAFDTEWANLSTVMKSYNDGTNDHYYRVLPAAALGNTYGIIVFNSADNTYRIQSSITIANQNNYSASQLEGLRKIGDTHHRVIVRDEPLGTSTSDNPDTYFYVKSIDGGNEGATGSWESASTKAMGWFIGKRNGNSSGRYYYFDTNAIASYAGKSLTFEYTMYEEGHTGENDKRWRGVYNQSGYTYTNYLHLGYYSNSGGNGFYVDTDFDSQMSE